MHFGIWNLVGSESRGLDTLQGPLKPRYRECDPAFTDSLLRSSELSQSAIIWKRRQVASGETGNNGKEYAEIFHPPLSHTCIQKHAQDRRGWTESAGMPIQGSLLAASVVSFLPGVPRPQKLAFDGRRKARMGESKLAICRSFAAIIDITDSGRGSWLMWCEFLWPASSNLFFLLLFLFQPTNTVPGLHISYILRPTGGYEKCIDVKFLSIFRLRSGHNRRHKLSWASGHSPYQVTSASRLIPPPLSVSNPSPSVSFVYEQHHNLRHWHDTIPTSILQ